MISWLKICSWFVGTLCVFSTIPCYVIVCVLSTSKKSKSWRLDYSLLTIILIYTSEKKETVCLINECSLASSFHVRDNWKKSWRTISTTPMKLVSKAFRNYRIDLRIVPKRGELICLHHIWYFNIGSLQILFKTFLGVGLNPNQSDNTSWNRNQHFIVISEKLTYFLSRF